MIRRRRSHAIDALPPPRAGDRPPGTDAGHELLASLPAREDLVTRLEQAYDTKLLALAMDEVKARVQPHTWQAFELLAIERRSGAEVAEALGIDVGLAYVARRNVQRMIRETITRLEGCKPAPTDQLEPGAEHEGPLASGPVAAGLQPAESGFERAVLPGLEADRIRAGCKPAPTDQLEPGAEHEGPLASGPVAAGL